MLDSIKATFSAPIASFVQPTTVSLVKSEKDINGFEVSKATS